MIQVIIVVRSRFGINLERFLHQNCTEYSSFWSSVSWVTYCKAV